MATTNDHQSNQTGLIISNTSNICSFLQSAASIDPNLSHDLQQTAMYLPSQSNVPYNSRVFSPVQVSSSLALNLEKSAYEELVKILHRGRVLMNPFLVTRNSLDLKNQASSRLSDPFHLAILQNAAGGILGLVCGMLLETLLFIIRTCDKDIKSSASNSRLQKDQ